MPQKLQYLLKNQTYIRKSSTGGGGFLPTSEQDSSGDRFHASKSGNRHTKSAKGMDGRNAAGRSRHNPEPAILAETELFIKK